eukprot:6211043-Pleurochrysis_carterae.AAC.1
MAKLAAMLPIVPNPFPCRLNPVSVFPETTSSLKLCSLIPKSACSLSGIYSPLSRIHFSLSRIQVPSPESIPLFPNAPQMRISAFHPVDTYQMLVDETGGRSWSKTLPHPMMHLVVSKKSG